MLARASLVAHLLHLCNVAYLTSSQSERLSNFALVLDTQGHIKSQLEFVYNYERLFLFNCSP